MATLKKTVMTFFDKLSPTYTKGKLLDTLESCYDQLTTRTYGMLASIGDGVGVKFSVYVTLSRRLTGDNLDKRTPIASLTELCQKIVGDRKDLERVINVTFKSDIVKEVMDYKELNILYYVNAISFFDRYCRALAISLVASERLSRGRGISSSDKSSMAFVEDKNNEEAFLVICTALARPFKGLATALDDLRGLQIIEGYTERAMGMTGGSSDPLKTNFIPVWMNPFFWYGELKNAYILKVYENASLEEEKLKLELMFLEQEKAGVSSEDELRAIQKRIDYYSNRIIKLHAILRDIEEDADY